VRHFSALRGATAGIALESPGRMPRRARALALVLAVVAVGCGSPVAKPGPDGGGPHIPEANAGSSERVPTGSLVILDGSSSRSNGGGPLTYQWTLSPPIGSSARLDDPTIVRPRFTADVDGEYQIQLLVNNGELVSAAGIASIFAIGKDTAPVANPGSDRKVAVGSVVTLDGSASSDADGDALSYAWSLTPPAGSGAALDQHTSVRPHFIADIAGDYAVTLVVDDGKLPSLLAAVTITATYDNLPPVAEIAPAAGVTVGSHVKLDGSGSHDPNGDPLTWRWTLTPPAGSSAALDDAAAFAPGFVADVAGNYLVTLVVSDGKLDSAPVSLTVRATLPPSP
jgi:hypothetical protein